MGRGTCRVRAESFRNSSRSVLVFLASLAVFGCAHSHTHLVPGELSMRVSPASEQNPPEHPNSFQIIITRNWFFYSHSAIRLNSAGHHLFWDPAGSYGDVEKKPQWFSGIDIPADFRRVNDLIVSGVPDLATYWHFARNSGDRAMEVFEWSLDEPAANHYYALFTAGATREGNSYGFHTQGYLLCSSTLTRFLRRFAGDIVNIKENYFFPGNLSYELYRQGPDRILIFEEGQPVKIYASHRFLPGS